MSDQTNAEKRVIKAAAKWRSVYYAWINVAPAGERDLSKNGENLALSKLLDALQALDHEHATHAPAAVSARGETQ